MSYNWPGKRIRNIIIIFFFQAMRIVFAYMHVCSNASKSSTVIRLIFQWNESMDEWSHHIVYCGKSKVSMSNRNGGLTLQWRHNGRYGVSIHYSLTIVYSTVYSGADQRKYQSSASLDFVRGIHRWPVNSPHKGPITRKMFPIDDVIMNYSILMYDINLNMTVCIREPFWK